MAKSRKPAGRRAGCLVVVLAVAGVLVGVGLWLGSRSDAQQTPCERYARAMARALDNCHSGQNRDRAHHIAVCEASVDPTPECLQEIRRLSLESCPALELGPSAAGEVCRKKP